MKITTRIISGYGVFIAVLVGLAVYQVWAVIQMQEINQRLKEINFKNATDSLETFYYLDQVEVNTEKSITLHYPESREAYSEELEQNLEDFNDLVRKLKEGARSEEERDAVGRLAQASEAFKVTLDLVQKDLPGGGLEELPESLKGDLDILRVQTNSVYSAVKNSIAVEVEDAEKTGQTAKIVLISVTVVVLSVTILVSLIILRSISKPLAHLTEGTRAITEGKYFYRLDTSRNDEFSQLAKDFNTMIQRLSELDELKKDFISHVSHEMKAPLASMRETVQLLIDQIPGPLTDKQKRLLELNLQSGDRLTSMIRNLLDLSKIEAGTMEYELVRQDLAPLVQTAVAEFEVQAGEKDVRIETSIPDIPLLVNCDSDRILQVLVNLIGNAVKFSPNGSTVRIRFGEVPGIPDTMPYEWRPWIAKTEPKEGFALLSIADSGPGIADSDKTKIFEKFHQVQKGKKVAGQGVGLGLAICRTIVRAHRGAVWVEDNPGGGSCFFLLLSPSGGEGATLRASHPI